MAKLVLSCPKCKNKLTAPEGVERFRCPTCKAVLSAPKQAAEPLAIETSDLAPPEEPQPAGPTQASQPVAPPQAPQPAAASGALRPIAPASAPQPFAAPGAPRLSLAPEPSQEEALAPGQRLAGYTITRLIGRGSMGAVYEAVQEGLKRRVALKVLPEAASRDVAFVAGFKREAQAAAKVGHPNIVQIFDIDEDNGRHFFSMEYVDGESLADRLAREGRIPAAEALGIVAQVAVALDHAYEHMLIHRDIKPSNILLTKSGEVKVADLGLSKSIGETTVGTTATGSGGALLYMAPELVRSPQLADCRSDIYALGCVLFHLLTGRPPFPGPTVAELMRQHASAPFPSARMIIPAISEKVDAFVRKMCAKDPAERFQTYQELLDNMPDLLKGTGARLPRPADVAAADTAKRPARSSWLPMAIAGAILAALAATALILLLPRLWPARPKAGAATTPTQTQPAKTQSPAPKTPEPQPRKALPPEHKAVEPSPPPKEKLPEPPSPDPPNEKAPEPKAKADEPKAKADEPEPKEEPKKGDAPTWQARLAEATKASAALAAQNQFGKALAALDQAAKDDDNEDLKKAIEEGKAAIAKQAAAAFEAVLKTVREAAARGKLDDAKAALQTVVDTYGTRDEVEEARKLVGTIELYTENRAALVKGVEEARAATAAAERRAAQQAELSKALGEFDALLEKWQLDEALAALGKLKCDDPALAAQVEQRKAAVEALAALRDAAIQHIKEAQPRILKSQLLISGRNGPLVDADKDGIKAEIQGVEGKELEKIPWAKLTEKAVERLASRLGKAGDAAQQLAIAFWLKALGSDERAAAALNRAGTLGAKTDALTDPARAVENANKEAQAARALADGLQLLLDGKHKDAEAALAAYKEKFAETAHYAATEKLLDTAVAFKPFTPPGAATETPATPEPAPPQPKAKGPEPKETQPQPKQKQPQPKAQPTTPGDEKKAKEAYDKAVAAFGVRDFDECKKQLAALREASPQSPLLADAKLNPSVATMEKAVAARGQHIKVSRTPAKGGASYTSLDKAFAAIEKPNATIEVEGDIPFHATAKLAGGLAEGLVLRGPADRRPRLEGGLKRDTIIQFDNNGKDIWIENLEFSRTKAALDVGMHCSITIRNCVATTDVVSALSKHAVSKVTVMNSILRLDRLFEVPSRHSALMFADKAVVENSDLVGCIIMGDDLVLRGVTMTDCLLVSNAVLEGGVKFTHVTAVGALSTPEDSRGIIIADSVIGSLTLTDPKNRPKEKDKAKGIAATLTNTAVYAQSRPWPKDQVKTEEITRLTRPPFEDPHGPDYRLAKGSPLRDKASDKSELGCRFPQEMLSVLRLVAASRYIQLLRPPSPPATKHK